MLLLVDNYDSFVHNIIHYIDYSDKNIVVKRNDKLTLDDIDPKKYEAIIISPGPMGPNEAGLSCAIVNEFKGKIPILGICLGHQCIAHTFGCTVERHKNPTHGKKSEVFLKYSALFEGLDNKINVGRYHSLYVSSKDFNHKEFIVTSTLSDGTIMSVEHKTYKLYGVQFHPESILTAENGKTILRNFLKLASIV